MSFVPIIYVRPTKQWFSLQTILIRSLVTYTQDLFIWSPRLLSTFGILFHFSRLTNLTNDRRKLRIFLLFGIDCLCLHTTKYMKSTTCEQKLSLFSTQICRKNQESSKHRHFVGTGNFFFEIRMVLISTLLFMCTFWVIIVWESLYLAASFFGLVMLIFC